MKQVPDAEENRRLGKIQSDKAGKLPEGDAKQARLKKARDYEADARSRAWRDSNLKSPK
ncbi:hypothetical protein AB7714_04515 [Tardiphaga sp. 1201_B9_N1_1]|jgi:hypothetical protein|uniref:hypothetical protein n=1 Tax=unclassified Tardiphaga TaxID=2631404 RepID=UPI000FEFACD1